MLPLEAVRTGLEAALEVVTIERRSRVSFLLLLTVPPETEAILDWPPMLAVDLRFPALPVWAYPLLEELDTPRLWPLEGRGSDNRIRASRSTIAYLTFFS